MKKERNNDNDVIAFPDNTSEIIFRLVKKYRLEKPGETMAERMLQGKKVTSIEIAKLVREIKDKKVPQKELVSKLKTRLGMAETEAKNLSEDIRYHFFKKKGYAPKASEIPGKTSQEKTQRKGTDVYREPIE